ncbi:MAG: aminoacyl-tRNA hydrolase [Desulfuromonas sp.]|nr:MAG: aminoacyl-tRNA hydrolase [Desulfuromonas sp.]
MKLIAGLGNPGTRYATTRHNIGFMVAERLAERHGIKIKRKGYSGLYGVGRIANSEAAILLPQTFMNRSGSSVQGAMAGLKVSVDDLVVIHDEIDLAFGTLRFKRGGGHGGHNGLRSIGQSIGSPEYLRVRVGVGRPEHGDVSDYVLAPFANAERKLLNLFVDRTAEAVEELLTHGLERSMNTFNNRDLTVA